MSDFRHQDASQEPSREPPAPSFSATLVQLARLSLLNLRESTHSIFRRPGAPHLHSSTTTEPDSDPDPDLALPDRGGAFWQVAGHAREALQGGPLFFGAMGIMLAALASREATPTPEQAEGSATPLASVRPWLDAHGALAPVFVDVFSKQKGPDGTVLGVDGAGRVAQVVWGSMREVERSLGLTLATTPEAFTQWLFTGISLTGLDLEWETWRTCARQTVLPGLLAGYFSIPSGAAVDARPELQAALTLPQPSAFGKWHAQTHAQHGLSLPQDNSGTRRPLAHDRLHKWTNLIGLTSLGCCGLLAESTSLAAEALFVPTFGIFLATCVGAGWRAFNIGPSSSSLLFWGAAHLSLNQSQHLPVWGRARRKELEEQAHRRWSGAGVLGSIEGLERFSIKGEFGRCLPNTPLRTILKEEPNLRAYSQHSLDLAEGAIKRLQESVSDERIWAVFEQRELRKALAESRPTPFSSSSASDSRATEAMQTSTSVEGLESSNLVPRRQARRL